MHIVHFVNSMIWSLAVQGHQSLFKALPNTESLAIFKVINLISPMENETNMEIQPENGILQRLQALEDRERRIDVETGNTMRPPDIQGS